MYDQLLREGSKQVHLELIRAAGTVGTSGATTEIVLDKTNIFTYLGTMNNFLHQLFYATTRIEIVFALTEFLNNGWIVVPSSCRHIVSSNNILLINPSCKNQFNPSVVQATPK